MSSWLTKDQLMEMLKRLDDIHEEPVDYCAWVQVKNGEIIVVPTGYEGIYPVLEAREPIRLTVNGEPVYGSTTVKPEDRIEWTFEESPMFRIEVSPDKMKAWFFLLAKERYALRLADHDRTGHLILQVEEDSDRPPQEVSFSDVMETVQQLGLAIVNSEAIYQELEHPTYQPILIARGVDPVPGTDAKLELFFKEHIESRFEEVNGFVDYRNHLKIPSVKEGDLIVRKHPMQEGESGYNVYGQKLDPPKPKDIILIAKQHVYITPDHEVYAKRDGRPRIIGNRVKFIDIATAHVVPGDVDLKTGNIVFSGDVVVYGNVTDGMIVEALGDIYVMGNVYRATLTATGSLYIKGNTIGSKLYSGYYGVLFNRLYHFSVQLNDQLKALRSAARQIVDLAASKRQQVEEGQLITLLIETKYKTIPDLVKDILVCISNIQNIRKEQMSELKEKLEQFQKLRATARLSMDEMYRMQSMLVENIELIKRSEEMPVVTDIQQCHLTEIMSNGDILIRKQGVLQSRLYSKTNIIFYDKDSACRGSELEAGGTISVTVVGGISGGNTTLKAGEKILINYIYEGRVMVQKFAKDILEPMSNVKFFVKANRLVVESLDEGESESLREGESDRDFS